MAEIGYNSKFEGREVDSRLENVVQAAPGTSSESGKGGLIPAPPAGSQDGSKTLLSDMTWGDHITKQYVDNAVSAAGWKKQIVAVLPNVDKAADNVMYLVKMIQLLLKLAMYIMNIFWLQIQKELRVWNLLVW